MIKMVQEEKYCLGDTSYLYMQHNLEKCHSELDRIHLKDDKDMKELKKYLADEIAQSLEMLDARATAGTIENKNVDKNTKKSDERGKKMDKSREEDTSEPKGEGRMDAATMLPGYTSSPSEKVHTTTLIKNIDSEKERKGLIAWRKR